MRSAPRRFRLAALMTALAAATFTGRPVSAAVPTVVVLHDSAGPWGAVGDDYALMLRNLLGHFGMNVTVAPVTQYDQSGAAQASKVFYIGSTYDEPSYYVDGSAEKVSWNHFAADVASGRRSVVWLGYNIWNLAWGWDPSWGQSFASTFGFTFNGLDTTSGYNRVVYKGVDLDKGVVRWANPGATLDGCTQEQSTGYWDCDTAAGSVTITDTSKATAVATATSTTTGAQTPYAVRSSSLWYVADIPFSYMSEEDRYLAMADLLHDMLDVPAAEDHKALIRLEDVNALTPAANLSAVAQTLKNAAVPYSIAAIPIYTDPQGYYNNGVPINQKTLDTSETGKLIQQLAQQGATIVQHGTTHQWTTDVNPYTRVTGDDYEFYRVTEAADHSLTYVGPIPGDSASWATSRVQQGRNILQKKMHLSVLGFEAPHYAMSDVDYNAVRTMYPVTYSRLLYFTHGGSRLFGQFYPYPVVDSYGYKVIPEDLGDVSPGSWNGYAPSDVSDIIERASKALVVRDGYASFFFHPYLDTGLLQKAIDGLRALGYHFVSACTVYASC